MKIFFAVLIILKETSCQNEIPVILSLIKSMEIRRCFLVYNQENTLNLPSAEKTLFKNIATAYISHEKLIEYIELSEHNNDGTCVILRDIDLSNAEKIWEKLDQASQAYKMSRYTWLVFLQTPRGDLTFHPEKLKIPYNCKYIWIQPYKSYNYILREYYWTTNEWFLHHIGTWKLDYGLKTINVSFYWRRLDLNGANITTIINERHDKDNCKVRSDYSQCLTADIIQEFARVMNFVNHVIPLPEEQILTPSTWEQTGANIINDPRLYYGSPPKEPYKVQNVSYIPFEISSCAFGPIYKGVINWYIKHPKSTLRSDYFVQPFHNDLWMAIILFVLVGTAFIVILNKLKDRKRTSAVDNAFLIFESLCNQSGNDNIENIRLRMICILSRLMAVIITALFGAVVTSFIAVKIIEEPFTNIEEFVESGQYKLLLYHSTYFLQKIYEMSVPLSKSFFEDYAILKDHNDWYTENFYEMICSDSTLVIIYDDNQFETRISDTDRKSGAKCGVHRISKPIGVFQQDVPLEQFSPYMDAFNHNLLRFYELGIMIKMQRIIRKESLAMDKIENKFESVELAQMTLVLSIPLIGVCLATLIIIVEFIYYKRARDLALQNYLFTEMQETDAVAEN